jgi:hypothetical protein
MKTVLTFLVAVAVGAALPGPALRADAAAPAPTIPDPAHVGETVSVPSNADVTLIGINIERGSQPGYVMERPRPGYEFIEASLSFHNPQTADIDLPLHAFLARSRGKTVQAPMVFLPNPRSSYGSGSLASGETAQGYVIYAVRDHDRNAVLIYRPDPVHPHHQAVFHVVG